MLSIYRRNFLAFGYPVPKLKLKMKTCSCVIIIPVTFFLFLLFAKVYCFLTLGKCTSKRKLIGKTALVTGSNIGIGYETALDFAKRGARVIITSENYKDLQRAQIQIIKESGNKNIIAKHLDFLSLEGVRIFAREFLATEEKLDILVNNAGTAGIGHKITEDGLLPIMQINYFGPFLLTMLLIDLLKKSSPSRIVNVGSMAANVGLGFDSKNINSVKYGTFFKNFDYCNSKICQASSTIEMAKRLKGTGVAVNCLHTGVVETKIHKQQWVSKPLIFINRRIFLKTPEQGAQTQIHLAVCEKAEGVTGKYYRDCRQSRLCVDLGPEVRKNVWQQSIQLVGLKPKEVLI